LPFSIGKIQRYRYLFICPPIRGLARLQLPKVRDPRDTVEISVDGRNYEISAGRRKRELESGGEE
jgi:hypothetical protein